MSVSLLSDAENSSEVEVACGVLAEFIRMEEAGVHLNESQCTRKS